MYKDWTLYCSQVRLKVGKKIGKPRINYFFSKRTPKNGNPCDLPKGYEVGVNQKTSMPYLKYTSDRKSSWKRR